MSRLEKNDILPSLESLMKMIEEEKIEVHAHHKDALKQVIEQFGTKERPMSAYFSLENWLYKNKEKPIEIRSAMLWGGLWVVHTMGCISWDEMRNLYGKYMSKQMDLR